jgi:hypothetical protein
MITHGKKIPEATKIYYTSQRDYFNKVLEDNIEFQLNCSSFHLQESNTIPTRHSTNKK